MRCRRWSAAYLLVGMFLRAPTPTAPLRHFSLGLSLLGFLPPSMIQRGGFSLNANFFIFCTPARYSHRASTRQSWSPIVILLNPATGPQSTPRCGGNSIRRAEGNSG